MDVLIHLSDLGEELRRLLTMLSNGMDLTPFPGGLQAKGALVSRTSITMEL